MYLPEQPYLWSAQLGPSLTNSYDKRDFIDKGIKNPEGKSRLKSPIPPDPGYGDETRPSSAPCGGRVLRLHGSDAKLIYKRATASDGAPYFQNFPYSNRFHIDPKTRKPTKNYLNENVKRIRRIMHETQQRQTKNKIESEPKPVKALWHLKQFDNVPSKVTQKLEEDNQRSLARSQSSMQGNFLRAHANTGPEVLRSQSVIDLRRNSVASSVNVPKKQVDKEIKPDYVKINAQFVKNLPKTGKSVSIEATEEAQKKQEKRLKIYQEKQKGQVPNYIEKRKEQRTEMINQARINAPDPECPPGHVKIDDNQRRSTLQQLQLNRTVLEKKLHQLPVRNDTLTLRRTKEDTEKKLVELDEAIEIFSKPKVFIKMDE